MKNKKLILIIIAIVLIVALIVGIMMNKKNTSVNIGKTISLDEVFNIENVEEVTNEDIKIEKTRDIKVSSKYIVGANSYIAKNKVEFNERKGTIIFLREKYNKANIYQTSYYIDKDGSMSEQIGNRIERFIRACTSYIGIGEEDKYTEIFVGKEAEEMPIEERIYVNKEEYSRTYEMENEEGKKYDLNFYMSGDYFICELVNNI